MSKSVSKKENQFKETQITSKNQNEFSVFFLQDYGNHDLNRVDFGVKFKKIGIINDLHIPYHNSYALALTLEYLYNQDIDLLYINGDFIDAKKISSFTTKPTDISLKDEIVIVREFIKNIKKIFPKVIVKFGNHDKDRLERYLSKKAPELFELEDVRMEKLLQLGEYIEDWVDSGDIVKFGKLNVIHGHEVKMNYNVVNIARTMYLKTNDNILFGHFHSTQEYTMRTINSEIKGAWSVGCLSELSPNYMKFNNWNLGFALVEIIDEDGDFMVSNLRLEKKKSNGYMIL